MAAPIMLTSRGQKVFINPDQIVYVEPNGSNGANVYLTNREYKQVEESADAVNDLWGSVTTVTVDHISDVDPETASGRRSKTQKPPETK